MLSFDSFVNPTAVANIEVEPPDLLIESKISLSDSHVSLSLFCKSFKKAFLKVSNPVLDIDSFLFK